MIDLRGEEMIEHIHGRREQDADVCLASTPAEDLSQEGFPHTGVTDDHDVGALLQEVQLELAQDAVFRLLARFVMGEVELVEGRLSGKAREFEAALDGAAMASFQLQVG
jgi:hypothetical protein